MTQFDQGLREIFKNIYTKDQLTLDSIKKGFKQLQGAQIKDEEIEQFLNEMEMNGDVTITSHNGKSHYELN